MADNDKCPVCEDLGEYPIFDRRGAELYSITCPECHGLGGVDHDPACRVCGCTENNACQPNRCHWVEPDLCSECVGKPARQQPDPSQQELNL